VCGMAVLEVVLVAVLPVMVLAESPQKVVLFFVVSPAAKGQDV